MSVPMPFVYEEMTPENGFAGATAGCSRSEAKSVRQYAVRINQPDGATGPGGQASPDFTNLVDIWADVLGDTVISPPGPFDANGAGRVNRRLPKIDPVWPYMYASNIPALQGRGSFVTMKPSNPLEITPLGTQLIGSYPFYIGTTQAGAPSTETPPNYYLTVEFTPRPYGYGRTIRSPPAARRG